MPNYKETSQEVSITGVEKKWTRSRQVVITNNYMAIPEISFEEEEIKISPNGQEDHRGVGSLREKMLDPSTTFNLLNPETDEVIGSASYQQIYVILYSLYMKLAKERDEKVIP